MTKDSRRVLKKRLKIGSIRPRMVVDGSRLRGWVVLLMIKDR